MANMRLDKNPMPEQEPNVRNKNFKEVALGYTAETLPELQKPALRIWLPSQCPYPRISFSGS